MPPEGPQQGFAEQPTADFELESLLLGPHPRFETIHSRAPGTILSRAYWLTDTITFGEMLL